jgi:peptide/nickel transport system permease protein
MRVTRFLLVRSLRGLIVLLLMIAITFALYFAIEKQPPVSVFFPDVAHGATATPQQTQMVNHLFFLDRSKIGLYFDYLGQLARGDFGHEATIQNGQLVSLGSITVAPQFRATMCILLGGALFVVLLALPLGAIAGSRIGSWTDRGISLITLLLVCTHPMMLALILRSAGGSIHWLPTRGYCPFIRHPAPAGISFSPGYRPCGGPVDWATHLILPWLTFALLFLALYTRMIRASVAETIHEDFVRTARAKGASEARILRRHVLPSAGLRVLTMVGMEIGTAIGVLIYIESAYNIGGLANEAVTELGGAGTTLDLHIDLAIVVAITAIVIIGNLIVDLLSAILDPRVGLQQDSSQQTKSLVGGVF